MSRRDFTIIDINSFWIAANPDAQVCSSQSVNGISLQASEPPYPEKIQLVRDYCW